MTGNYDFNRNKLKGNTAEEIFKQMFAESRGGRYIVYPFGWERLAGIAEDGGKVIYTPVLRGIQDMLDFMLKSRDGREMYLVEVKYRGHFHKRDILHIAEGLNMHWPEAWLFVASLSGFYFGRCQWILENGGWIGRLREDWVPAERQDYYLGLLRERLPAAGIETRK